MHPPHIRMFVASSEGYSSRQGAVERTWVGTAAVSWILSALVVFTSVVFALVMFASTFALASLSFSLCLLECEGVTPPCGNNRNSQQNPMSGFRLRD